MRVLEALKILEAATIECKKRDINTPDVRTALDVLQPYCQPEWVVAGFRNHLRPYDKRSDREGQQQVLRVYFGGIYRNVRQLLLTEIKRFSHRYEKTTDAKIKRQLDQLKTELIQLPEQCDFRDR